MSFSLIVGNRENYFTQLDNEFEYRNGEYKVNWNTTCNVTSLCEALKVAGYEFPRGKYSQPEDNLADFILNSPEIDGIYRAKYPALHAGWRDGLRTSYSPLEVHDLLCEGANLWFGRTVDVFRTDVDIPLLFNQAVNNRIPVPVSVRFGTLNHVIVLTGASWENLSEAEARVCSERPDFVFYDDPYGKFDFAKSRYVEQDRTAGYCNKMTWREFVNSVKPLGNAGVKWAHMVVGRKNGIV